MLDKVLFIQFAKWPVEGRVKTRLAKDIGDQQALAAHIKLTEFVLNQLVTSNLGSVSIWFDVLPSGCVDLPFVKANESKIASINAQQGKDLGVRMLDALCQGIQEFDKVIIVGSDCPSIDSHYLAKAIEILDTKQMVFGPAEDGGFVLIGCSKRCFSEAKAELAFDTRLFEGVSWGGADVLKDSLDSLKRNNISYGLLDYAWDVDEVADWNRFLNMAGGN
jgi:rSAM/selenodomain-associated transferase 1